MTLFDNIIRIVSGSWEAFVLPYKPIWVIFVVAVLAGFSFKKSRTN